MVVNRIGMGSFLEAVLCNDLWEACSLADDNNLWILPVIVAWLYNNVPAACWGSSGKYKEWVEFEDEFEDES